MTPRRRAAVQRPAPWRSRVWSVTTLVIAFPLVGCTPDNNNSSTKVPTSTKSNIEGNNPAKTESSESPSAKSASSSIQVQSIPDALAGCVFRNGSEFAQFTLPETTGGGIAILDMDRDGRCDIVCAGGGYPAIEERVMRGYPGTMMRGLGALRFIDSQQNTRIDMSEIYSTAISVSDYDADGFSDLLVAGYSGLQLFRNQGDGTFEKLIGAKTGLTDTLWSSSVAWFDPDNDGILDLYVAHYADWSFDNHPKCHAQVSPGSTEQAPDYCGPREYKGLPDTLYANLGDGTFRDVTEEAGILDELRGLGVLAADLDGDLDMDLYVANDVDPNLLYRNEGGFRFLEIARRAGVASNDAGIPEGSMGIALGDFNGDTKFDLWVTNYQNEVGALYRNSGNMSFAYASNTARIPATDETAVGWGTAFVDMDLDGKEDIVIANGHIELYPNGSTFQQRPQILQNVEHKYFRLVPRDASEFLSTPQSLRSLAVTDLDGDGRMDFVVNQMNADSLCVRNTTLTNGHYLKVRLVGTRSNRDAIGTTVRMQVGGKVWVRQLAGGGTYAGTNDNVLHFGIRDSDLSPEMRLEVLWPSGTRQSVALERLDQELFLIEQE